MPLPRRRHRQWLDVLREQWEDRKFLRLVPEQLGFVVVDNVDELRLVSLGPQLECFALVVSRQST